jgi:hypothetical protein
MRPHMFFLLVILSCPALAQGVRPADATGQPADVRVQRADAQIRTE